MDADGSLRHPSFKGLREDKPPREIVRERPADGQKAPRARPMPGPPKRGGKRSLGSDRLRRNRAEATPDTAQVAGVRITHPDRVLYRRRASPSSTWRTSTSPSRSGSLPHLRGRPTSLVRCPDGLAEECFYQKHVGTWAPTALRRVPIREKKKIGQYLIVDDLAGLISLVQLGILEIHAWNSVYEQLEQPDRLVFDLDPADDVPWREVVAAARTLRNRLRELGLESFVKTTGGKGFHLVVPIENGPGWDDCLAFSRRVAEDLAHSAPRAFTANMAKSERRGRIYIDYLRNLRGATSVAAYSTRARPGAGIDTPGMGRAGAAAACGSLHRLESPSPPVLAPPRPVGGVRGRPAAAAGAPTVTHEPRRESSSCLPRRAAAGEHAFCSTRTLASRWRVRCGSPRGCRWRGLQLRQRPLLPRQARICAHLRPATHGNTGCVRHHRR